MHAVVLEVGGARVLFGLEESPWGFADIYTSVEACYLVHIYLAYVQWMISYGGGGGGGDHDA